MTRSLGSRYVLESVIGRGGFGEVWRGHDVDGRARAFKLLHSGYGSDEYVVQRFVQERSILMSLSHPNLVRVHDMVVEGETLALVMDLVEGGDLKSRVKSGPPLERAEALELAAGVAAGLGAAHARGVIHRDVKPENVLLDVVDGRTVAKLVDFGISRIAGSGKTSTVLAGTLTYVAPELFDDVAPTVASDLYALGVTVYELLAGGPPFRGNSLASLMRMHSVEPPSRPDDVADDLWGLLERLLAKDPADRPASAAEVAEEMAALATEPTVEYTLIRPVVEPSAAGAEEPVEEPVVSEINEVTMLKPRSAPEEPEPVAEEESEPDLDATSIRPARTGVERAGTSITLPVQPEEEDPKAVVKPSSHGSRGRYAGLVIAALLGTSLLVWAGLAGARHDGSPPLEGTETREEPAAVQEPVEPRPASCWEVPDEEIALIVRERFAFELADVGFDPASQECYLWSTQEVDGDSNFALILLVERDDDYATADGEVVFDYANYDSISAGYSDEGGRARWRSGAQDMELILWGAALSEADQDAALQSLAYLFSEGSG